jgi:transposase
MMNSENVAEVVNAQYEYIFGERLKNIAESKQDEILDLTRYTTINIEAHQGQESIAIKYYTTQYKGKRLIATYSSKRAAKDKAEREEKIAKALAFLADPSPLDKKAKHHYLKKEGKDTYVLDDEKISRSQKFDGFFCIATNNTDLSVEVILDAYKQLYRIEHSFRSFKTFLETRPMFHWTEKRILGHLSLCYMSFAMLNYLQLKLQKQATPQSENQIRRNLINMQMSLVSQNDNQYYLRSKTTDGARQIMKTLTIHELPDLIPRSAINQYL